MLKKIIAALVLSASLFMYSCSDDNSTNPTTDPNYFPNVIGNYWTYKNYETDSLNNKILSTEITDQVTLNRQENETVKTISNALISILKHQYSDNTNSEQKVFYQNDIFYQKIDQLPGLSIDLFGVKISDFIEVSWVNLIDFKNAAWVILPKDTIIMKDVKIKEGVNTDINIYFSINGRKGATKQFTIGNKTITANEYTTSIDISGTVILKDLMNFQVPITSTSIVTSFYFADGVGLVGTKTLATKINIAGYINQTIDGNESTLINYKADLPTK
jgi:hypothetical protein